MAILERTVGGKSLAIANTQKELVAQAAEPVDLVDQPGKIRTSTKIFGGILAASIATLVASSGAAAGFAVAGLIVAGLGSLVSLSNDLAVPSVRRRREAREAAQCYAQALRRRHWKKAYACIQPQTRPASITLPKLLNLGVMPDQASFSTAKGFKKYWKAIVSSKGGTIRSTRKVWISEPEVHGDLATAQMIMYVEKYPTWIVLTCLLWMLPALILYVVVRKTIVIESEVRLFRHKSQWWVLPGEVEEAEQQR